ncbi:MAG: glycosyltransferase, partial [Candidatus Promineifilaceae bacterium]
MPAISIIIPHLNGRHHLDDCLKSLRRQTWRDFEALLVDNGSTDGTQDYVAENYPEIKLIQLPENRGFTGACNAGWQAARGEIIILLNNDTEADPRWLAEVM